MTRRRICVVTGSRADYGLLRWVMEEIERRPALELQVVATGTHLVAAFGRTVDAIEADGFRVDWRVEMLLASDTAVGVSKSMGLAMIGLADAYAALKPDVVLVLGDRYEALCAVVAANVAALPVGHIHGGELTQGAMDDAFRHSITKMAHLHFVAAPAYRDRVLQLGESRDAVYLVGALAVDAVRKLECIPVTDLEMQLGFRMQERNLLVTFHPETLSLESSEVQFGALLGALSKMKDTGILMTYPNADPQGLELIPMIEKFVAEHPHAHAFRSLGQLRYLSAMRVVDAVVGNSSSGLLEAPVLGVPTVNIGGRQEGRLQTASVINCPASEDAILEAISQALDSTFAREAREAGHPFGDGQAASRIADVLSAVSLRDLRHKRFVDRIDADLISR